jgi:hypothetical protein
MLQCDNATPAAMAMVQGMSFYSRAEPGHHQLGAALGSAMSNEIHTLMQQALARSGLIWPCLEGSC